MQRRSLPKRVTRCKKMYETLLLEQTLKTLGGRISCQRCLARSKRTKQQCRAPAISGRKACKNHGGLSTGPRTEQGRQRCAEAKTSHGNETRKARAKRAEGMRRLRSLEELGYSLGIMAGPKTPGRKQKLIAINCKRQI